MNPREALSFRHIKPGMKGIEIGGLHFPLSVPQNVQVTYVDRMSLEDLNKTADVVPVQHKIVVDDAEKLENFPHQSQDFLIANHVLEHCHDPIGTLRLWLRTVKTDGIVYAALPEKNHTFDSPRSVTTIDHMVTDWHLSGQNPEDQSHYREWFRLIDKLQGQELEDKVRQCYQDRTNIHFHVFDKASLKAFMTHYLIAELGELVEFVENGAEILCLLRRK